MDNTIGLIIWGCKGGHRILCSDNIDYQDSSIANTTKDIRSFVRFNLVNLTTYAIEFTDKYKIFTIYRSSNDSGTGGYIAITVYIPHNLRIEGLRPILDDMMNAYFNEYVHPILCSYLPGKYDNIELFLHILKTKAVTKPDANMYSYKSSEQNNVIRLRLYDSIDEVDRFFASPYRKEFFCSQEVMFMSRDMYNHIPDTLTFNLFDENNIIKTVSEPETLPVLSINFNDIVSLKINAMSCDKSQSCPINTATDTIEIVIKKEYCEDRIIKGRVSELLRNGTLKESNKIISIGNIGNFTYKNYPIKFCLNGNICPDNVVYVEKQNQLLEVCNSKVEINGQDLASDWNIYLTPLQGNKPIKVGSFKPKEYVDNDKPYEVESSLLSFKVRVDKNVTADRFNVFIGNVKIDVPIDRKESEKSVTIYLPNNIDSAPNWKEYGDETVVSYNEKENTLIVSSKILRYTLEIPKDVRDHIQDWDFEINNKSCKKTSKFSDSPYTVEINSDDDISKGKLYIDKDEYRFSVYDNIISPRMICIVPDKYRNYYEYTKDGKKINSNSLVYFPYTGSVSVPNSERSEERNVHKYKIKEKEETGNKVADTYTTGRTVSNGEQPTRTITYIGCKGLKIDDKEIKEDKYTITIKSKNTDPIRIKKGKKELCVVYKNFDTYVSDKDKSEKNENNGFNVDYNYSDGNITVRYKKPKSRFVKFISSKTGIMTIIGVLAVLAIAVIGYLLYNPNDGEYVMIIDYQVEDNDFGITLEELETKSSTDKIKVGKNTIYVYFNEEGYDFLEYIKVFAILSNKEEYTINLGDYSKDLNAANKSKKKMDMLDKDCIISSKLQIEYIELIEEIGKNYGEEVTKFNIDNVIKNNSVAVDKVIEIIFDKYKDKDKYKNDKITLKKCIVETYKDCTGQKDGYFDKMKQDCESYDKTQKEQQEAARKYLIDAATRYKKMLRKDHECTSMTVNSVLDWYNRLSNKDKKTIKEYTITHTVKKGETLYSLAKEYGCNEEDIKKLNRCDETIKEGQDLKVPLYDFDMAIKAYNSFFNAKCVDDIKKVIDNYLHYFSKNQQGVIKIYEKEFDYTNETFGVCFSEALISQVKN